MEEVAVEVESSISGQIEIPFVPTSQRQSSKPIVEDTLVVVGKQKKRKRSKKQADEAAAESNDHLMDEDNIVKDDEVFDYDTAPNILDVKSSFATGGPHTKQRRRGM